MTRNADTPTTNIDSDNNRRALPKRGLPLADTPLGLHVCGTDKVAERQVWGRFKRLLNDTWSRLPSRARRTLTAHWGRLHRAGGNPGIMVSDGAMFGAWARVCVQTSRFDFRFGAIDLVTDEALCVQIAHELAHVYCFVSGHEWRHDVDEEGFVLETGMLEKDGTGEDDPIEMVLTKWGFDWQRTGLFDWDKLTVAQRRRACRLFDEEIAREKERDRLRRQRIRATRI